MKPIDEKRLISLLPKRVFLRVQEETGSTNDDLKRAAKAGAADDTVLICHRQLEGRGREGRRFFSGNGLYMSVILPPRADAQSFLTHIAAIAVAQAIKEVTDEEAKVKWVNDVLVRGKKVSGILTESVMAGESRRLVLGIGVNANTPAESFPEEIKKIAGSLPCDDTALAAAILNRIFSLYYDFSAERVRRAYRELCFPVGTRVLALKGELSREATVLGLDDALALIVRYEDGSEERLISGEVRVRSI